MTGNDGAGGTPVAGDRVDGDRVAGDHPAGSGILAIETSQARGSVAWLPHGASPDAATESLFPVGLVHGREILPRIDELSRTVPFPRTAIRTVAVSAGPGSFTGARIGVATGKALAYALGARLLGVSSLEAIARGAVDEIARASAADGGPVELAVLLDARRELLYGARFAIDGTSCTRIGADVAAPVAAYLDALPADTLLVGDGARSLASAARFRSLHESFDIPRATTVAAIAAARIAAIEAGNEAPPEWNDPHVLIPSYLRRTSAEEARDAREGGA